MFVSYIDCQVCMLSKRCKFQSSFSRLRSTCHVPFIWFFNPEVNTSKMLATQCDPFLELCDAIDDPTRRYSSHSFAWSCFARAWPARSCSANAACPPAFPRIVTCTRRLKQAASLPIRNRHCLPIAVAKCTTWVTSRVIRSVRIFF